MLENKYLLYFEKNDDHIFVITLEDNKHKQIDVNSLMILLQTGSHLHPRTTSPNKQLPVRQCGRSHLAALCIR